MRIDSLRTDLPPQSAPPVRCGQEHQHLPASAGVSIHGEQDERVGFPETVTFPKPETKPETKCIVTSFCPHCGQKIECQECGGVMPIVCHDCATNTPKGLKDFGKAVSP